MQIAIFEDPLIDRFKPLTYTKAFFDLRTGMYSFAERIKKELGSLDAIWIRKYLEGVYKERLSNVNINSIYTDEDLLLVNSRLLVSRKVIQSIEDKIRNKETMVITASASPLLVKVKRKLAEELLGSFNKNYEDFAKKCKEIGNEMSLKDATVMNYPWDLIDVNAKMIREDFSSVRGKEWEGEVDERAVIYGDKSNVYVSKGARVEAFSVLDAREGPIFIGENTRVAPGALIEGPAYVGKNSLIVAHALIREGTNIGDVCRIGGEVEESIIHGFSNKYHAGFLGHAYVGEWVNLGALTTNSDLKNTYGTIKVIVEGEKVDTGLTKIGSFIGDMAKTSIGTLIYTGKKIGLSSHVHGVIYEDVPSFTIYAKSFGTEPVEMYIEAAIETQRRMMSRRGKELTKAEEDLIRKLFEMTAKEREKAGVKKGRFML